MTRPPQPRMLSVFFICTVAVSLALAYRYGEAQGGKMVNSAGKVLPPDAAPLARQIIRFMSPEPRSLDSSINDYDTESTIIPFEPLLRRDENWNPEPGGAVRYESSKDGKTWTFHLRPGARWSDGRPVTAGDFVYSYRRMLNPEEANPYAFFYYDFKNGRAINRGEINDLTKLGVRAADAQTLVIETETPAPYLPYIVSFGNGFPVPSWQVEKYGRKWTLAGNIVSNSGFKLGEWINGKHMTFVPDPMYNGPHKPYVEKVIHPFREASAATILAYENNEVDYEAVDLTDLARIKGDPKLAPDLVKTPGRGSWYLFFKTKQAPFNDIRVREAFTRAIDRNAVVKVLLNDMAYPAYSMIPPEFADYQGPAMKKYQDFNPARAKQLMKEAGFAGGRGFPKQELWLRAPTPTIKRIAEAMVSMLKDHIGVDVTIRTADRTMYMNDLYNWRMNLGLIVFFADYQDSRNMLDMIWHSQPVGFGRSDWSNANFDRLVEQAGGELNPTRRQQQYRQAEEVMVADYAAAFVFHPINLELRKSWIKGYKRNPDGTVGGWDYARLYVGK